LPAFYLRNRAGDRNARLRAVRGLQGNAVTAEPPIATMRVRLSDAFKQHIVLDGTASPVKTALFVIVCIAWLLPGLVGHDPWKPEEAIAFGAIYDLISGGDWLVPSIAGAPYLDYPPFFAWVGALFAQMCSPVLALHDGARLASGFFMALAMVFVALGAMRLVEGRAGRVSALMLIGSLGLLLRGHEIGTALPPLAGMSIALYGLIRLAKEPLAAGWFIGAGAALVGLSAGAASALLIFVIPLVLVLWKSEWRKRDIYLGLGIAFALALPAIMLWPLLLMARGSLDARLWISAASGVHALKSAGRPFDAFYFVRILPWYALPALPVALWVWWRDRKHIGERIELALPLLSFAVLLVGFTLLREPRDDVAMPLLLPLILAAAQGLDRLPRGLASFIDWFGTVTFFFFALLLWTGWTAAVTGVPRGAARWVERQAPGYVNEVSWLLFAASLAITLVWLFAVFRTRRTNRRAIVNWAAGITLIWVLTNLLWLPAIDHVRSYRDTATAIKASLPAKQRCIAQFGLGDAQRAAFDYHAGLRFIAASDPAKVECDFLLTQGERDREPEMGADWKLIWQGARPGDKFERFRLYRRPL
jgi:4-amino-4-deoxy-L-arabinose transferase-like glycosyltransferase